MIRKTCLQLFLSVLSAAHGARRTQLDEGFSDDCPTTAGHATSDRPVAGRYSCSNDAGSHIDFDQTSAIQAGEPLRALAGVLPWFLPGLAMTTAIALAVAGGVARRLRTENWIGFLLVMSVGAVLAATIPPTSGGWDRPSGQGRCDFGRIGLAPLSEYLHVGDTSLNVILFVPLGLAVGLLGRSPSTARVLVAAFALPPAIEAIQSLAPALGRGCESRDVIDNLLGLGIGLLLGALLSVLRARRPRR
jgi:VanZ family protein